MKTNHELQITDFTEQSLFSKLGTIYVSFHIYHLGCNNTMGSKTQVDVPKGHSSQSHTGWHYSIRNAFQHIIQFSLVQILTNLQFTLQCFLSF